MTYKAKKHAFYFNTNDELFAKPNELLREANELSDIVNEKIRTSQMLDMEIESAAAVDAARLSHHQQQQQHQLRNGNLSSVSSRMHHHHQHHGRPTSDQLRSRGGKITIGSGGGSENVTKQVYEFKESDMLDLGQIGNGEFGTVHKVLHRPSQVSVLLLVVIIYAYKIMV